MHKTTTALSTISKTGSLPGVERWVWNAANRSFLSACGRRIDIGMLMSHPSSFSTMR